MMDVAHRRCDMRVTKHGLHVREWERAHGDRTEAVTEVVESDWSEASCLECSGVPASQGPAVYVLADRVDEDEVVVTGEVLPAR